MVANESLISFKARQLLRTTLFPSPFNPQQLVGPHPHRLTRVGSSASSASISKSLSDMRYVYSWSSSRSRERITCITVDVGGHEMCGVRGCELGCRG